MTAMRFLCENLLLLGFGAFGCLAAARVGVFNIAAESSIVSSLFAFVWGMRLTHVPFKAGVLAILAGLIAAGIFSVLTVVLEFEEIVSGIAVNMFMLGLTTLLTQKISRSKILDVDMRNLWPEHQALPWLISVFVFVLLIYIYVFRLSRFSTKFAAVGFDRSVAFICDIPVRRIRVAAILIGGAVCALAGISLAVAAGEYSDGAWKEGVGYLSLALVFAARSRLDVTLAGAFIFAIVRFVSIHPGIRSQNLDLPEQVYQLLPYIVMIVMFSVMRVILKRDLLGQDS